MGNRQPNRITNPRSVTKVVCALLFALALNACATGPALSTAEASKRYLGFLEPGETTREQVISRFGTPASVFENERILTWRLRLREGKGFVAGRPFDAHQLTVVFDDAGSVARFRLIGNR